MKMKFVVREIIKEDIPIIYKFMTEHEIAFLTNYNREISYEEFNEEYELSTKK